MAECYRNIASAQVYSEVICSDITNNYFLSSRGIRTPDFFQKNSHYGEPYEMPGAVQAAPFFPDLTKDVERSLKPENERTRVRLV